MTPEEYIEPTMTFPATLIGIEHYAIILKKEYVIEEIGDAWLIKRNPIL